MQSSRGGCETGICRKRIINQKETSRKSWSGQVYLAELWRLDLNNEAGKSERAATQRLEAPRQPFLARNSQHRAEHKIGER